MASFPMQEDDVHRRVGTLVRDKWTLVRLLGTGGMAAVYVGVHRIGRRDALKILHREAAKSKEVCLRFEREAQAVNRFRHPGAVEIRDIDVTEDGAPFLVMELLVGESLGDRAARLGTMGVDEVLSHAEQVLDVLAAAHQQGIIHRDIKPGNLFVSNEGRIKVLDFGLARIHEGGLSDGLFTKEGATLGTTPYMPPEQAKGRPIDERADIFSVGATMFRLLTGRYLHDAQGAFDLLMKQAKDPAPPIARYLPNLPARVGLVIDRALAFDREQRYPDAVTMLDDVRAAIRGEAPPHASQRGAIERSQALTMSQPSEPEAGSGGEIPIYLSGFSGTFDPASTDREPAPELRSDPSIAKGPVEATLASPGNEPPKPDPNAR
ncbi:Serine/threonine protein kinase PknB [Minicystis rosea]|nr:Serine/threonine protein kinase PknB [Minicystis rosea]